MKNFRTQKIVECLLLGVVAGYISGCASAGTLWDVGTLGSGVAAGALIGDAVTDSHWGPVGGAVAGGLTGIGLNSLRRSHEQDQFNNGYEHGLSDSVKRQYWIQVNMQKILEERDEGL